MNKKVLGLATCFNRKEKTIAAINQLVAGNTSVDFSFIITDDNSRDGTAEALSVLENVQVLHGDGNSYYTGGMRIAIGEALQQLGFLESADSSTEVSQAFATSLTTIPDYIMLFNDDVSFYPGAIETLLARMDEKAPNRIIVGPTCEADGETMSYGGVQKKSNFAPKIRKVVASHQEKNLRVDTFNANCVLVPTHLFLKTGNMDKVYRHSLGDYDYGFMLARKGGEIYVIDEYIGMCPFNSEEGSWRDPKLSRKQRFKEKESIKGVPFKEFYHYILKNYNFPAAVFFSISPYIRILLGK